MTEQALATVDSKPNVNDMIAKVSDKRLSFGQRINTVADVMKAMASRMMAALPKHITADRMIRVSINCIRKNPKLLDCDPASLFGAITEAATYGWELGGVLGHGYLVPYKRECVLIPGYKGMIDLCRRSGQISTISMEVVHEGDRFDYSLGDDPHINHRPNDRDPKRHEKPIIYVYAVVKLRDGGVQRSVWSSDMIDAHKAQYSQAWRFADSGPRDKGGGKKDSTWHTNWAVMAKKTVIRDMINRGLIPVSAEYRDTVQRGVQHDDDGGLGLDTIDIAPTSVDEMDAIEEGVADDADRPQTTPDAEQDLIDLARLNLMAETDEQAIEVERDRLLGMTTNEASRAAINGLANERKAALRQSAGAKKQKQGALVN